MTIGRETLYALHMAAQAAIPGVEDPQMQRLHQLYDLYRQLVDQGMLDTHTAPRPGEVEGQEARFLPEAPTFSDEAKKELKDRGKRIVPLEGLSALGLEARGAVLGYISRREVVGVRDSYGTHSKTDESGDLVRKRVDRPFAIQRGRVGEVAIDSANFLLQSSDGHTLAEQEADIVRRSGEISSQIPGVRVVMDSVPTWLELDNKLWLTAGVRLFGPEFPVDTFLRTNTLDRRIDDLPRSDSVYNHFWAIGRDNNQGPEIHSFWDLSTSEPLIPKRSRNLTHAYRLLAGELIVPDVPL